MTVDGTNVGGTRMRMTILRMAAGGMTVTLIVGVFCSSLVGVAGLGISTGGRLDSGPAPHSRAGPALTPTVSGCELLATAYPQPNGIPHYENYSAIFSEICETAAFTAAYNASLAPDANRTFVIGTQFDSAGVTNLTFSLYSTGTCTGVVVPTYGTKCIFEDDWIGYLSNNSFSGPIVREYPVVYVGPSRESSGGPSTPLEAWIVGAVVALFAGGTLGAVVLYRRRVVAVSSAGRVEPPMSSELEETGEQVPDDRSGVLGDIF